MKLTKAKLLEIVEEELQEIIKKKDGEFCLHSKKGRNLGCYPSRSGAEKREREVQYFKSVSEEKADKHFSPRQSPGQADDTFHDCINSVKKSFKKHDYKPDAGDTVEDAAAKICTDARKEGGATLDYGEKRKKEVERARPGGKSGK